MPLYIYSKCFKYGCDWKSGDIYSGFGNTMTVNVKAQEAEDLLRQHTEEMHVKNPLLKPS